MLVGPQPPDEPSDRAARLYEGRPLTPSILKAGPMKRKHHTPEQIIEKLREAEVLLADGKTVADAAKALQVTEQTYYRWKRQYGRISTDEAKRLRTLERENERLKRLVADLSLDNAVLKELAEGKW